jgi:uncharacterized membrane protein YhaH (DUF805 family)
MDLIFQGALRMSSLSKRIALAALFFFGPLLVFAQDNNPGDAAAPAAGCFGCGACGGVGIFLILIPIAIIALNIAMLVWVARDAKARGMDNSVGWMALVFFTSLIGLVIYIFSRPQGNMVACPNCNNQKLQAALRCPHCGFGG